MKDALLRVLFVNVFLLPGEAGFAALVMYKEGVLNLVSGLCALGILFTINFFISSGFSASVEEERIENE